MKAFFQEFREFINRGNVVDLAVAVIIGGAFTGIVTSLTDNIINPLIAVIAGGGADQISGLVIPGTEIDFGALLSAVINFLIVALVVFLLVKAVNKAQSLGDSLLGSNKKDAEKEKPPVCPFCLEEIKEGATRCPHCTGVLPEPARPRKA
ncbi:MAG: large conductance mechanosensitive channel protein MscL [Coriobacteriia bacterium]|nr:large conductance mechanosensitive channel protein MscL [Coriobacteriia bacterium]MBS5478267.1 large conductance mechanosensitive channel protein MscL [Coriobacteriia bacterium]